jgi:hypothetical protein
LDTDTELIELLTVGASSGDKDFEVEATCSGETSLTVYLYDPCDVNQTTIVKTVYVPSITLQGDSYTANVGGNASQTFNWRSSDGWIYIYSGEYTP